VTLPPSATGANMLAATAKESIAARPSNLFTSDLELLFQIARREITDFERLRQAAAHTQDWSRIFDLAAYHGLLPLLSLHLEAHCADLLSADFLDRVHSRFAANAQHNLRLTQELFRALDLLSANGITAVPYKGPALGLAAFGGLSLRESSDLDILLRRADVLPAKECLRALSYAPDYNLTPVQEGALLRNDCEYVLVGKDGVCLELHWDIAPRFLGLPFPAERIWPKLVPLQMAGRTVLSLSPEHLLWALCIHASKHVWSRICWIADIAELIRANPEMNWEEVVGEARNVDGERVLRLSLYLAQLLSNGCDHVGASAPENADHDLPKLAAHIVENFWRGEAPEAMAMHKVIVRAQKHWRKRALYIWRAAVTPTLAEYSAIRFPEGMQWLYPPLRLWRLFAKYCLAPGFEVIKKARLA
jgi:hypothetical protein